MALGNQFKIKATLCHLRVVDFDIEAGHRKFGNDRHAWCCPCVGCIFLIAEAKNGDRWSDRLLRTRYFILNDQICEPCLLVLIHIEDCLPVLGCACHIVRMEDVYQAFQIFFKTGTPEAKRAL